MVRLFEDEQRDLERQRAAHEEERAKLYAEIGRLATQLAWLKKKPVSTRMRRERVAMLDWDAAELDIKTQAALLGVNRSGLYYQPVAVSAEESAIKRRIDEICTATPFYGSPKSTAQMNQEGWGINHKRVERYLVAVLDWYSRYVVAWEVDETLEMPLVLSSVDRALACAVPGIFNSDQGSHFTSSQYTARLLGAGARISLDGRGRAFDNG
jgi:putative transposase